MTGPRTFGVYGASGFGREVMPLVRAQLASEPNAAAVFVDDRQAGTTCNGVPVVDYATFRAMASPHVTIAIADATVRARLAEQAANDGIPSFAVHAANAMVLDDVMLGPGAIICGFVTLTSNIRIGQHFHANLYAYVAHDCVIGDFVTLAPAAKINGNVIIENHAYIGTGAIIRQGRPGDPIVIGRGAVVGMGAVVTKSVSPGITVVGNPARPHGV